MKQFFLPLFQFAFCILPLFSSAQKINLSLQHYLQQCSPEDNIVLPVQLSNTSLLADLSRYDATHTLSAGGWHTVRIPAKYIPDLAADERVSKIYFSSVKGQVLNDTMVINNRVTPIHTGNMPLNKVYKGNGVILGLLDTGIEINHPDFKDSNGNTRILRIWDQNAPYDGINPYGYGKVWEAAYIDAGLCTHDDAPQYFGHGSIVTGIAAGNGLAVGKFSGVAPEADIVLVAIDFTAPNWTSIVADATHFVYSTADTENKPCAINASIGTYGGSHDGSDPGAIAIDSMIKAKNGRSFVCAAGNAGHVFYHLGYPVTSDTTFTWFQVNNGNTIMGVPGVCFELWADTAAFSGVSFAFGADKVSPTYSFRGRTAFDNIQNRLNITFDDTIKNNLGQKIAHLQTWAEVIGDKYLLQLFMPQPDSNTYYFRLELTGNGMFDVWSDSWMGFAKMVKTNLPTPGQFPPIIYYRQPDTLKTIVGSFTCLPTTITVANYTNRSTYMDYNNNLQVMAFTPGAISATSSIGPTRTGMQKPDIGASGDITLSSSRLATVAAMIVSEPFKVAQGGMHNRNGGTSLASPVVAGTAALYLEKCPEASWQEIKQAITGTAYTDGFTGAVPNYRWGFGKTDAFAALLSSTTTITITLSNDTLYTSQGFAQYQWFLNGNAIPGATGYFHKFTQDGLYRVEVIDNSGCQHVSSALPVGIRAHSHTNPIIQMFPNPVNNILHLQSAENYLLNAEISNLQGQLVQAFSFTGKIEINVSCFPEGVYLLRVQHSKGIFTGKFVKM